MSSGLFFLATDTILSADSAVKPSGPGTAESRLKPSRRRMKTLPNSSKIIFRGLFPIP
jgi:hypothetical protein